MNFNFVLIVNRIAFQVGGDGDQSREIMGSPAASIWKKNLLGFALNNFLPLGITGQSFQIGMVYRFSHFMNCVGIRIA